VEASAGGAQKTGDGLPIGRDGSGDLPFSAAQPAIVKQRKRFRSQHWQLWAPNTSSGAWMLSCI
jgi:hypothetical protein